MIVCRPSGSSRQTSYHSAFKSPKLERFGSTRELTRSVCVLIFVFNGARRSEKSLELDCSKSHEGKVSLSLYQAALGCLTSR